MQCYCGSQRLYAQCCQPFVSNNRPVENCEQLMRSRYSAYCIKDATYIFETYHSSMQLHNSLQQITNFANSSHFIHLELISSQQQANEGSVHFIVTYLQDNGLFQFKEHSKFVLENNWRYMSGHLTTYPTLKIGRNDLCPCGSKKKFKQCKTHIPSGNLNEHFTFNNP